MILMPRNLCAIADDRRKQQGESGYLKGHAATYTGTAPDMKHQLTAAWLVRRDSAGGWQMVDRDVCRVHRGVRAGHSEGES